MAQTCHLLNFPLDALIALLSHLGHQDLLRVGATCTLLRNLASSDCLWASFCSPWEDNVNLEDWRADVDSWMALFRLLKCFNDIVGYWASREPTHRGGLLYVTWGHLSVVACRVVAGQAGELKLQRLFEVAGLRDGSTKVELITTYMSGTSLTEIHQPGTLVWPSRKEPEFYLELAGLLETSESSNGERELGLHGTGNCQLHLANSGIDGTSFDEPVMQDTYRAESSMGREPIKSSLYRKLIVEEPCCGKELVGLWSGIYGAHGVEVINVTYTDEEIIGTKVLGDPNVPCGQVTFRANFSLESTQVPVEQQIIVDEMLESDEQFTVVKLYRGSGRIADNNFINPEWIPGQLLVNENCDIAFQWDDDNFIIPFCKLNLSSLYSNQKHVQDNL